MIIIGVFSIYEFLSNRSISQLKPMMMISWWRLPVRDNQTKGKTQTKKFSLNFKQYLDTYYKDVYNFIFLRDCGEILGILKIFSGGK